MRVRTLSLLLLSALASTGCARRIPGDDANYVPPGGYVPNEATAIAIAKAVWIPIYGRDQIESEAPFVATLDKGVWHVHGTLPKGYRGGTAEAVISRQDGRILQVLHGK